jgi:uncharacterized protein YprB with RNaseH-like and TPR domain
VVDASQFCVLDIETAGGDFRRIPEGFDLLVAGVKWGEEVRSYEDTRESLAALADFLEGFTGMLVTFNGGRFDLPILQAAFKRTLGVQAAALPQHFDILAEIARMTGRRVSLASVALSTLGYTKGAWDHGRNRQVWKTDPDRLRAYNREDLELTAKLFSVIASGAPLSAGGRRVFLNIPALRQRVKGER